MATRLQSAFRSLNDDYYKILINDSAHTGSAVDVNVGGDGFTLTHDGETDTVYSTIVGSSVSLTIYNDSIAVDIFRTALLNAQDKQFSLRILRAKNPAIQYKERVEADGGTIEAMNCVTSAINALGGVSEPDAADYNLFWVGYITQDLIEEADESKPRGISIKAADGISLLSTVDYQFGLAQSFQKSFKNIICEILDDSGIADLFEATEDMLTTVVNWYADEHTYAATTDPLTVTKFDLKAFTTWSSGATRQYTNSLQVIREMAVIMGARFYFANGSFRFEQIGERDQKTIREFYYLNDNTANGYDDVNLDTTIDKEITYRSNGTFRYLPAVKRVNLTQQKISAANLIGGTVQFPADEIDVGIIPSANNGHIILDMVSSFQTFIATPQTGTATPVFDVTIRLEPTDGTANQYWKNSLVSGFIQFGVGSWSTTAGTYKWAANSVGRQTSSTTITQHSMATGPLPKDGEIYIDIDIVGFYDATGSSTSFFIGGNSYNWNVYLNTAKFENDNAPADIVETTFTSTNTSTNIGSNIAVDLTQTRLGDGPGAAGSLYAYTGSAWTQSTGWREANSGSYVDIAELVTSEILALQNNVVRRFEGTMINGGGFSNRFVFDIGYWLPMRSTFVANNDELEIEAFLVKKNKYNISSSSSSTGGGTPPTPIAHYSGGYTNSSNGVIAGMVVNNATNAVGPFSQTASGGKVTGTALITGDATLQAGMDHQGFLIEEITEVEHYPANIYNVGANDYMIFNTWQSGASTGTSTINLPAASDYQGRLLRFKSDGTIGATKSIDLVPQSGETIDGEADFEFNRDYDGVMILAHNGDWYIIQRKAK